MLREMTSSNAPATSVPGEQPPPDRPLRELRGVVERLTFQSAATGFTVARLAPEWGGVALALESDLLAVLDLVGQLDR